MNTVTLPRIVRTPSRPLPARQIVHRCITWLERLAAWSDRQPQHRRLGSWTAR